MFCPLIFFQVISRTDLRKASRTTSKSKAEICPHSWPLPMMVAPEDRPLLPAFWQALALQGGSITAVVEAGFHCCLTGNIASALFLVNPPRLKRTKRG
jgi:hypothetical protein